MRSFRHYKTKFLLFSINLKDRSRNIWWIFRKNKQKTWLQSAFNQKIGSKNKQQNLLYKIFREIVCMHKIREQSTRMNNWHPVSLSSVRTEFFFCHLTFFYAGECDNCVDIEIFYKLWTQKWCRTGNMVNFCWFHHFINFMNWFLTFWFEIRISNVSQMFLFVWLDEWTHMTTHTFKNDFHTKFSIMLSWRTYFYACVRCKMFVLRLLKICNGSGLVSLDSDWFALVLCNYIILMEILKFKGNFN